MYDTATRRPYDHHSPDLATIVLSDRPVRRRMGLPESELAAANARVGYDARSALVLALVVGVMAGVIGWSLMLGREAASVGTAPDATREPAATTAEATILAPTPAARVVVPAAPVGIDLEPGRITAMRSGAGGGIVRIGVANRGTEALAADRGAQVLVLLDGETVGERTLGAIDATGSATTEVGLDSCPSGRRALVVVIDPRGLVREADERDNARSQAVSFGC